MKTQVFLKDVHTKVNLQPINGTVTYTRDTCEIIKISVDLKLVAAILYSGLFLFNSYTFSAFHLVCILHKVQTSNNFDHNDYILINTWKTDTFYVKACVIEVVYLKFRNNIKDVGLCAPHRNK